MKRIVLGMIGAVVLCMVACGNSASRQPKADEQVVKQEQKKRGFQLPEVPAMLNTPELRLAYVVKHYWDHFDFRDTAYIHLPDITEQAAVNYMDLLPRMPQDKALAALSIMVEKASVEPLMMDYVWKTFFRYWYEPNSPLKNEEMFILFCKSVEQTPKVEEYLRERAAYLRSMAEKNRVGMKATDFVYTLASGKQGNLHALKAEYTLLFFYNPDCHTCSEIKRAMKQSLRLKDMVAKGQMKVLTVYPDEDVALWRERLPEMEKKWVNAYDKNQLITHDLLYDLSSIPSFYLLDKDKKVLLKDADWRQVLHFFEK